MNGVTRRAQEVVRLLLSANTSASLYGTEHPQVARLTAHLFGTICATLEELGEISLMVIENELIINGIPQDFNLFLNRFSQALKSRDIEHVKILRGITRQEVESFIGSLSSSQGKDTEMVSSEHLRFGYVEVRLRSGPAGHRDHKSENASSRNGLSEFSREELAKFEEIHEMVRRRQKLKISGIIDIVSGFVEVFRQEGKPLLVLAALRENDEYTFTHSTNVCILNLAQARALGIQGQLLKDIGISAMLHDIGKLFVPEEIINKKGKLTSGEFELMKEHPSKGARYLMETAGVPRMATIAAFEHHAKFNLSGYPKFASNWQLNLCSHLTMISDFFDATRTRRSYREPLDQAEIAAMMFDLAGTELHPVLTRNFLHILYKLKNRPEKKCYNQ
jgi:HD-GYP domain-containing protein (c-di-GMP phosphodiesterase class II)